MGSCGLTSMNQVSLRWFAEDWEDRDWMRGPRWGVKESRNSLWARIRHGTVAKKEERGCVEAEAAAYGRRKVGRIWGYRCAKTETVQARPSPSLLPRGTQGGSISDCPYRTALPAILDRDRAQQCSQLHHVMAATVPISSRVGYIGTFGV